MVIKWALFDFQLERESTKKQLQALNPELIPARLRAVKQHFRCCRNLFFFYFFFYLLKPDPSRNGANCGFVWWWG